MVITLGAGPAGAEEDEYWEARYFNNTGFGGGPIVKRQESEINYDWGYNSPVPGTIQENHISIRWTKSIQVSPGLYRFSVTTDDGVRLWVNVVTAYWLNVRWGPGVGYGVLTTISRGTAVGLTHRNHSATWARIVLPSGVAG